MGKSCSTVFGCLGVSFCLLAGVAYLNHLLLEPCWEQLSSTAALNSNLNSTALNSSVSSDIEPAPDDSFPTKCQYRALFALLLDISFLAFVCFLVPIVQFLEERFRQQRRREAEEFDMATLSIGLQNLTIID